MPMNAVGEEYREELVKQIKDAGEELIDRAESLIPEKMEGITGFSIDISFPQGDQIPIPEIRVYLDLISLHTMERWRMAECLKTESMPS